MPSAGRLNYRAYQSEPRSLPLRRNGADRAGALCVKEPSEAGPWVLPSVVALGSLQWRMSARLTELPPPEQPIGPLEPND